MKIPIITIDGPSGVGKSTLCKILSNLLKWNMLNSGLLYRFLAFAIFKKKIIIENNEKKIISYINSLNLKFKVKYNKLKCILNKKCITENVYDENIGNIASKIASIPEIREFLLKYQRELRSLPGLIAEGRDMGTVVFPDANAKIFLNSSIQKRTMCRMLQLKKKKINVVFNDLLLQLQERDHRDKSRSISPLIPSKDAFIIDVTNLSIDEVKNKVIKYISNFFKII